MHSLPVVNGCPPSYVQFYCVGLLSILLPYRSIICVDIENVRYGNPDYGRHLWYNCTVPYRSGTKYDGSVKSITGTLLYTYVRICVFE